tara:strand:+ start:2570 stop:3037 length:468 start_codon:yes stop_codon:yes gene_type:complete
MSDTFRYFSRLDSNNQVVENMIIDIKHCSDCNGVFDSSIGVAFLKQMKGSSTNWVESKSTVAIGDTYMKNVESAGVASTDIFIRPQPYPSWSLSTSTVQWIPPVDPPTQTDEERASDQGYEWDEDAYQADTSNPKTVGWAATTVQPGETTKDFEG